MWQAPDLTPGADVHGLDGQAAMWGDNCRTGCATRDHLTYGDCLRAARIQIDRESLKVQP